MDVAKRVGGSGSSLQFSEASQMIKQELWFGTYDNSVGHLQGRANTQA